MNANKLTQKQQRFVEEYLIDLNATQSAIRAGYSANRAAEIGYQLLQKTTVAAAIQATMQARSVRTGITADTVISDIERIKQDAMQAVPDKDGNMLMANHAAALKAAELQGKHLGMFKSSVEVSGKTSLEMLVAGWVPNATDH